MEVLNQFFKVIAWASTVLFLVRLAMISYHGGADSHGDFDDLASDGQADLSFHLISFQSILAFGMGFGWIGQAALVEWGLDTVPAILASSVFGFAVLILNAFVMSMMKKLNQENQPRIEACIGQTGRVYLTIPDGGSGQVEITFGGGLKILDATSESGKISTSQFVVVTNVRSGVLVVKTV
jgi:membrane protein implicated in regulation of membrane protease activity